MPQERDGSLLQRRIERVEARAELTERPEEVPSALLRLAEARLSELEGQLQLKVGQLHILHTLHALHTVYTHTLLTLPALHTGAPSCTSYRAVPLTVPESSH